MIEPANDAAVATEQAPEQDETRIEPIPIAPEDLTEEGRKQKEERIKRPIPDFAYEVTQTDEKPGSIVALTFAVNRQDYTDEQTRLLKDLAKEVTLPGFRKGKAPLNLLRKRVGEESDRETIGSLATNTLRQEHAKQEFKLLGTPQVTDYDIEGEGEKIGFVVEVEVEPKIELKKTSGFELEVEDLKVTDEDVDKRIEQMRQRASMLETAPEGAELAENSTVVLDVEVTDDKGEIMEQLSETGRQYYDYRTQLPEEVASQLKGKKAGDAVEADVESSTKNRRGEEVKHTDHYKVTVKEIKIEKLPELDDEFAKDMGEHETLADLKAAIRKELDEAETQRRRSQALQELYKKLIEENPVPAPRSLVSKHQYNMIMDDSYQLQRMGLRLEQVVHDTDKYLEDQRAGAEHSVKVQLILDELKKQENLEVTDADVDAEIAKIAERSGRKPLAIRAKLEADKQLESLRNDLANRKINDFLLEKNSTKLIEPKPEEDGAAESGAGQSGADEAEEAETAKAKAKPKPKKAAKKTAAKKTPSKKKSE